MNVSSETLELIKVALSKPDGELAKAWVQASSAISGITAYDLEAGAKMLFPVLTPLRNKIPRVSGKGGIQANWRSITGINTNNMSLGVSEGNRGGVMATTTADYLAIYCELGLEDFVTWKAQNAAVGFDDLLAIATENLLKATMIGEEQVILGGQGTWALARPVLAAATIKETGGTMTAARSPYTIYVVALTLDGYKRSSVARGIVQDITRVNIDGSTDTIGGGSSRISASVTATITNGATVGSVIASCAAVPGAVAYAWFWGANGQSVLLGAITTVNSCTIATDIATGTQTYASLDNASDHSKNTLIFDGFLAQLAKSGSGAYIASLDGAGLTSGQDGSIVEIDDALQSLWDEYRLSPDRIWVGSQEMRNVRKKIMTTASGTGAQRFVFNVDQGKISGGTMAISYLNPFGMGQKSKEIPIELHPNMPNGTMMLETESLPYPLSNVTNLVQMLLRQDYFAITWPMVKRRREYGVYFDGVLQNYFPPAFALIQNIGND